ncbi:MAG: hypothetical protein KBF43_13135 [Dermatophilaceae bacterium]|nr:hypothetical protein [Actinomycetales bacterium]MBP8881636.1 hypothetical protein [Dermatophilaceae bacterium]MBP9919526.1 hypothetical protein [Dermatophilaceae bacterium]
MTQIGEGHSPASSVVYGLEGPWGSGKSSVIALLTSYLTEPYVDVERRDVETTLGDADTARVEMLLS